MSVGLFFQAIAKFLMGLISVGLLLFLPAGDLNYSNGWMLMGILFIPMFCAGIVMMLKNPQLLKKRLKAREEQGEQRKVIAMSGIMFVVGFVLAGLGYRYNWYILPKSVSFGAAAVFLASYGLYAEVLRENTYLSRTIEVQEGQKVIDTGLYGIVRHPMYSVTIFLFLSIPLVLGSVYALGVFCIYPLILVKRIKNEEDVLTRELPGYAEYKNKVRYRVIPFIW